MQIVTKLALAALALTATAGLPLGASPSFDGEWSVEVNAISGYCDQSYRVPITVSNGQVNYSGRFFVQANGAVDGSGGLSIQLAHGGEVVHASGQLGAEWGSGEWASASLNCSGTWLARRG